MPDIWDEIWIFLPEGKRQHRAEIHDLIAPLGRRLIFTEVLPRAPKNKSGILPPGVEHQIWKNRWGNISPSLPVENKNLSRLVIWFGTGFTFPVNKLFSKYFNKAWKAGIVQNELPMAWGFHLLYSATDTPFSVPLWHQLVDMLALQVSNVKHEPNAAPPETPDSESV